ncbi:MAG: DUF4037 domain-containing protein [Anaerolineae bacterium]|nr:DUF4037 domain-containing protein [Anaerolineae bacterium]
MTTLSPKQQEILNQLVGMLQNVDGIEAIALGGSFARGIARPDSDLDIGLYYADAAPFPIDDIRTIAHEMNDDPEVTVTDFWQWGRWVNGGAWLTIQGQRVDFLYRSLDRLAEWVARSQHGEYETDYYQQPATGFYSYIYLAELSICQPLYDPAGKVQALKEQVREYPPALKQKIIADFGWMAEFTLMHAEKAAKRGDLYMLVGCLHRALSGVFQVIYAQNERYFISDRGALDEISTMNKVPQDFVSRVDTILKDSYMQSAFLLRDLLAEARS